jgi:hypothetical protein
MIISSKGRATVVGAVVLVIAAQAAVASALDCRRPWPASFSSTECRTRDGKLAADGRGVDVPRAFNRETTVNLVAGHSAFGQALTAFGGGIAGCTTVADKTPSDGHFVIGDCFSAKPPAEFFMRVE